MSDVCAISLGHIDLPDYDYERFARLSEHEARGYRIGNTFTNEPFDRSPGDIKVDRPVGELMAE